MNSLISRQDQLIIIYDDQKFDWLDDSYILGVLEFRYNQKHKSYEIDAIFSNKKGWGSEIVKLFGSWAYPGSIINDTSGKITEPMYKLWDKLCEDSFFSTSKKGKKLFAADDSMLRKYPQKNLSKNKFNNIIDSADNMLRFEMNKIYSNLADSYQLSEETQEFIDELLENKHEWVIFRDTEWDDLRFTFLFSSGDFYILMDGVPVYIGSGEEESRNNWNWLVQQKKDKKKAKSFFDPITKRGLMEKGPAYFDPSLDRLMK